MKKNIYDEKLKKFISGEIFNNMQVKFKDETFDKIDVYQEGMLDISSKKLLIAEIERVIEKRKKEYLTIDKRHIDKVHLVVIADCSGHKGTNNLNNVNIGSELEKIAINYSPRG